MATIRREVSRSSVTAVTSCANGASSSTSKAPAWSVVSCGWPLTAILRALINYGLEFLNERGYIPLQTPQLMLRDQMAKTAQLSQYEDIHTGTVLNTPLTLRLGLMRNSIRSVVTSQTST